MERRFATRLEELLDDAIVDPAVLRDMLPRLERFVQPFATLLDTPEQRAHLQEYVSGLVSNVKRKNVESIAYHHDQDRQAELDRISDRRSIHPPARSRQLRTNPIRSTEVIDVTV